MKILTKLPNQTEVLVVGGGPAGLGAAIEAATAGSSVVLVDENDAIGGQLSKQIHKFFGSHDHYSGTRGYVIAQKLCDEAQKKGVLIVNSCKAIGPLHDGRMVLHQQGVSHAICSNITILATGGKENSLIFPHWTLPGIMTAGAAQTLCNIHRVLPANECIVVGSGNVGLIVAYQLLQAGCTVKAIVEIGSSVGGYEVHAAKITRAGIPILLSHTVCEAHGNEKLQAVTIKDLQSGELTCYTVDGLFIAVGLTPRIELAQMLGLSTTYISPLGGRVPLHGPYMQGTDPTILIAGDAAGIEEANTSLDEGRLAGLHAAHVLIHIDQHTFEIQSHVIRKRLEELRSGHLGAVRSQAKEILHTSYCSLTHEDTEMNIPYFKKIDKKSFQRRVPKKNHPVRITIECTQDIPCDPCIAVCSSGAIEKTSLCSPPVINHNLCNGCLRCIASCPGQAIFGILSESVIIPWEYLPQPRIGENVLLCNREGKVVGEGSILDIQKRTIYDHTLLVHVKVPQNLTSVVRSFRRMDNGTTH